MNTAQLLTDLEHRGVVLHIVGDRLKWKAPRGALTELDLQSLATNKTEILAALTAELEVERADLLLWGECYAWPSVRVDELVIDHGDASWSEWVAHALSADFETVRTVCYWHEGERDEWLANKAEISEEPMCAYCGATPASIGANGCFYCDTHTLLGTLKRPVNR